MATSSSAVSARPLFLVYGTDGYRVRLRARELALLLARGDDPRRSDLPALARSAREEPGLSITRLSAREASPAAVLMATRSEGLFAMTEERRVVVLEDAEAISDSRFLREAPTEVALLLVAAGPLPRQARDGANGAIGSASLPKLVRELGGAVEEFHPLDETAVERWLSAGARARGLALEPDALVELVRAVGADLERGERELDKLAAYAAGETLGAAHVRALVPGAVESDVFELTGAVVRRDVRAAVQMLERLLDGGEPPQRLVGLLVWQFRSLLIAAGTRNNAEVERAAHETGLSVGALLRARRHASGVRQPLILRAYEALYAADLAIKSGRAEPRTALQLLVLDLCGVEGADVRPLAERGP